MEEEVEDRDYQDYQRLKDQKMKFRMQPAAIALTNKPKYMYPLFNLF
jgi:hypothetical protein